MRLNPKTFNRRIVVQKKEIVVDEMFNNNKKWIDYYKCAAGVSCKNVNEEIEQTRPDLNTDVEFKIRYCRNSSAIDAVSYRIFYNGNYYKILSSIDVNEAHQLIKIKAVIITDEFKK